MHIREPSSLRNDNLLTPWELTPSTTECLLGNRRTCIFASDGEDHLPNVDACDGTVGLAPSSTHTRLKSTHHTTSAPTPHTWNTHDEPISSSARQHLVNPNNMERMYPDPHMERILPRGLRNVLICANTLSFKRCSYSSDARWQ